MSFARPTLSDLIARVRGDFAARIPGADGQLRHSLLDVLARTHGGALAGVYGYIDWLARQLMPDTAEAEHLERWASIWGVRRKAAVPARAVVLALGTDGAVIAQGTAALRIDGAEYRVVTAATIVAGEALVSLEASAAGPDFDLSVGDVLTLANAVVGVTASLAVDSVSNGGVAEEDDAALLARLLARIRLQPQGGAAHDYVAWALAQPGVTRAWAWPGWMGLGTVGLSFVIDGREDILPTVPEVAAVQAALDLLRPVTAQLHVFAPTAFPINVVLRVAPDTPEVRAAISAELDDFFARDAEPGGTIYLSRIREAISLAAGEFSHVLELPDSEVTAPAGQLPMLGTVSFVG